MDEIILTVDARTTRGKGPARRERRDGRMPAVFYGPGAESIALSLNHKEFAEHVASLEGARLIRLKSSSAGINDRVVVLRETQVHPVSGRFLHADLYEVDLTKTLEVAVPLHFVGKCVGVVEGGILQPILREIQVECLPTDIPQFIEVDVTELGIHDAVHLEDLKLPPNVTGIFESNDAVVTVLAPTVEEAKPAEAAAEGVAVEGAPVPGDAKEKEKEKDAGGDKE